MKRTELREWVTAGEPTSSVYTGDPFVDLVSKYAPGRTVTSKTTLDQLGLSSLDRLELLVALEQHLNTSIVESALASSLSVGQLAQFALEPRPSDLPVWSRSFIARLIRNCGLALLWLPLTRLLVKTHVTGLEKLHKLREPVIFAPNHQSNLDTPCILAVLPARYRYRVAAAMWKEYFDAHFHPERYGVRERLKSSFLYMLIALFFNGFPIPQTQFGASSSLRYIGDLVSNGWSVIFFPEGRRNNTDEILPLQPGIGLIASKLHVLVVPIRLRGMQKVLPGDRSVPRVGCAKIAFGKPLTLRGADYSALTSRVGK